MVDKTEQMICPNCGYDENKPGAKHCSMCKEELFEYNYEPKEPELHIYRKTGAYWFFWISILSLINTYIILSEGTWRFIFGLGTTDLINAILFPLGNTFTYIALFLDVAIALLFMFFGYYALKRKNWAYIIGMIVYAVDGLLFIVVKDFVSIAFHLVTLALIFRGYKINQRTLESETNKS